MSSIVKFYDYGIAIIILIIHKNGKRPKVEGKSCTHAIQHISITHSTYDNTRIQKLE